MLRSYLKPSNLKKTHHVLFQALVVWVIEKPEWVLLLTGEPIHRLLMALCSLFTAVSEGSRKTICMLMSLTGLCLLLTMFSLTQSPVTLF